ncbi:GRF1-interacting factor 1 [Senna tora]|uniref:GRF1-interacting factor 1 n=1 Tax=Senna tora TaxID=362788 RepID=A0A834SKB5_9FABA|nr:GRF1-interacting factor 1 [Senna tora]
MQQHLMQMQPMMAAYYPSNVTTDHIQQARQGIEMDCHILCSGGLLSQHSLWYLDENKSLILKIVESQNSGKLSECAESQARLQRNLMYLAAIADSQPQPPTMPGQYPGGGIMQQGTQYLQGQQAQQMSQQQLMAARSSLLYAQQPYAALQQQQALHSQLGMSSSSANLHMLQTDHVAAFPDFVRTSKPDIGTSSTDQVRGGASAEGGETLNYLKSSDDAN